MRQLSGLRNQLYLWHQFLIIPFAVPCQLIFSPPTWKGAKNHIGDLFVDIIHS